MDPRSSLAAHVVAPAMPFRATVNSDADDERRKNSFGAKKGAICHSDTVVSLPIHYVHKLYENNRSTNGGVQQALVWDMTQLF